MTEPAMTPPATEIIEPAPAKLNLALHVRARRPDGYHDIETLFVFCRDGDVVTLADADRDALTITGPFAAALAPAPHVLAGEAPSPFGLSRSKPGPHHQHGRADEMSAALRQAQGEREGESETSPSLVMPNEVEARTAWNTSLDDARDERDGGDTALTDNLVTRALHAFRAAFAVTQPHAITLEKNLPVASGIGGGSADAAATLRALARRHGITASDPRLHQVAAALGADVPACLHGRATFGTGRGDALAPVAGWHDTPVLLVNPGVAVSTAAVFAGWDGVDRGALDPADPHAGRNDLEAPARRLAPAVADAVALLAAQPGAVLARMSGSGATCFALFDTPATRDAAATAVAATHPNWWRLATTLA